MNMFPHTMTIYRYDGETYSKQVIDDVYWHEVIGVNQASHGVSQSKSVQVTTSPDRTKTYGVEWDCKPEDRIILGNGEDITTFKGLNGYTVLSIAFNTPLGNVDNIVITGA